MDFKLVKPILNFPLACFPKPEAGRSADLYDLRVKATRKDGWFLVKCGEDDVFSTSFKLDGDHVGEYMLGVIKQCPGIQNPSLLRYEVFVHGGSKDASTFCLDEQELLTVIDRLDRMGMDYVIGNDAWEATEDLPFVDYFTDFPQDLTFEMLFGTNTVKPNARSLPEQSTYAAEMAGLYGSFGFEEFDYE